MRFFLGTEFTQLSQNAKLISLGIVTQRSLEELYLEVAPLPAANECSDFVRETVLPLLGRYLSAACAPPDMRERILNWLQLVRHCDEDTILCFDSEYDCRMIRAALDERVPAWLQLERISSRDCNELLRVEYHSKDKANRPEHHALHDAHALAYSYRPRPVLAPYNPLKP